MIERLVIPLCLVACLGLTVPQTAAPAVITVGPTCNLIAAIEAANDDAERGGCPAGGGADIIRLNSNAFLNSVHNTIDGPNGLPSVTSKITIEGRPSLILRASSSSFRIFHVAASGDLTLDDVIVTLGSLGPADGEGGGIFNRGTLRVVDSSVSGNEVVGTSLARGGGIYTHDDATTTIVESRIALNTVEAQATDGLALGGGVYKRADVGSGPLLISGSTLDGNQAMSSNGGASGGGLYYEGNVTVSNSTVSGNSVVGASWAAGGGLSGELEISNTTISGNSAVSSGGPALGGGVWGRGVIEHASFHGNEAPGGAAVYAPGPLSISGSIFAASTGDHCDGAVTDSGGGNVADDDTCLPTISATVLDLGPLGDNGGTTETHALGAASEAIDAAGDCGLATDQRPAARVGACDSGAYERVDCLREYTESTVDIAVGWFGDPCHSVIMGPDFIVTGPNGSLTVLAGYLVTLKNGVEIQDRGVLSISLIP